jgi:tetratricopeptide (TPR) repeat protein
MQARAALAAADKVRADIDADYDRSTEDWPRAERAFREVADQLARTQDPLVATAWLGVGRATHYQRGRRDDALHAFIEALHWERDNVDAWLELVDMASAAPHVPTLIDLLARVPFEIRPSVLGQLLTMSYGRDRLGKLSPATGENLRDGLLALAESQGDAGTVAYLAGDAGLTAEKAGDLDSAVRWWRRAIAAGSTDEKVADKLSIWLTKRHEYEEAEQVLRQALVREAQSPAVADRLRRRLTRCEQNLAG